MRQLQANWRDQRASTGRVLGSQEPSTDGGARFPPLHLIYSRLNTDHQWSVLFPFSSGVQVRWCYTPSPFSRCQHQNKDQVLPCRAETVQPLFYPAPQLQGLLLQEELTQGLLDPLSHRSQVTQPQPNDCCSSRCLASLLACLPETKGTELAMTRFSLSKVVSPELEGGTSCVSPFSWNQTQIAVCIQIMWSFSSDVKLGRD